MPDTLPTRSPPSRFKLAALSAVGVAMVALPLYQVLRYQGAELQAAMEEQAGLDPVVRSVAVQRSLLVHRDVAGRVLRGQAALEAERRLRQDDVDERVAQLAGALVVVATDRAVEESNALREDWARLARQIQRRQVNAPESDLGHRLLVEQTLQVIDLVADATGLGGHRDAGAAMLASVMTRSLPRLANEIAALGSPGATGRPADERQMAATEAALARSLGRLNEVIENSSVPRPALAAATADAGAAADRYFTLLREQPDADVALAGEAALQAQFRLLDATRDVLAEVLTGRVSQARQSRDVLVALMAVLALLALGLARRVLTQPQPPGRRWRGETPAPADQDPAPVRNPLIERRSGQPRPTTSDGETGRLLERLRQDARPSARRPQRDSHAETQPPDET
ncbi:MAG: hypothetical protein U5L05_03790 [Rubrivivax sp.]|nr:hypothetical protein [Rubrivivax sp.]